MPSTNDKRPKAIYGVRDPVSEHLPKREGFAVAGPQAAPITYRAFPSLLFEQVTAPTPEHREIVAGETEKRAVWIVHGMGQQIPFETLDSLTEGIIRVANPPSGAAEFQVSASSIRIGDEVLQRVELKVRSHDNTKDIELHLYEAYWAPLTEGVANLRDVTGFLVNGALRGILNSVKTFKRAMFGEICDFKIRKRVPLYILGVLILLGSLTVINATILAATGNRLRVLNVQIDALTQAWPALTALASAVTTLGITLGAILFLVESCKSGVATKFRRNTLSGISWVGTLVTASGIVAAAGLFVLTFWPKLTPAWLLKLQTQQLQFFSTKISLGALALIGLAMMTRARKRSEAKQTAKNGLLLTLLVFAQLLHIAVIAGLVVSCFGLHYTWPRWLDWATSIQEPLSSSWCVWPFLIFLSAQIRTLMVEYAGDVVIYMTSNKIDRFNDVRKKIKDVAYKSASAIFHAMTEDGKHFEYEKVAIIGHSLGSAMAYDTLNRLINDDRMTGGKMRIAQRTCLLETFGSPLNKLAFFFTIQGTDSFQIREQLAESVQPLIMDYEYRPYPWINVRSPNDIISGEVYLYDWPPPGSKVAKAPTSASIPPGYVRAIDEIDPDASVALAARVNCWKNHLVWERLYKRVTA